MAEAGITAAFVEDMPYMAAAAAVDIAAGKVAHIAVGPYTVAAVARTAAGMTARTVALAYAVAAVAADIALEVPDSTLMVVA